MSILDTISKFVGGGVRQSVRCGAHVKRNPQLPELTQCVNIFELPPGAVVPDIPICPNCEKRFNMGIRQTVHAYTGKLDGSYNIFDQLSKK